MCGYGNVEGFSDWLKSAWEAFKAGIGLGQPQAIYQGTALAYARQLYEYCYKGGKLKRGDTGNLVKTLQFLLNILGYKVYSGPTPDGIFGPKTESAVIDFQAKHGMVPTGVVDGPTAYYLLKEIEWRTKTASVIPSAVERWIQRQTQGKLEELRKKHPEYFQYPQTPGQTVITPAVPVRERHLSPLLVGGVLILAAFLLMGKPRSSEKGV